MNICKGTQRLFSVGPLTDLQNYREIFEWDFFAPHDLSIQLSLAKLKGDLDKFDGSMQIARKSLAKYNSLFVR